MGGCLQGEWLHAGIEESVLGLARGSQPTAALADIFKKGYDPVHTAHDHGVCARMHMPTGVTVSVGTKELHKRSEDVV